MSTREPSVIFATVGVSDDDEIPIECRFDDGQKFAAVRVAAGYERLAERIADFLSATVINVTDAPLDSDQNVPQPLGRKS